VPADAAAIDPQARLTVEAAADALAAASPDAPRSTTALYVGAMYHEYLDLQSGVGRGSLPPRAVVGCGAAFLVGRAARALALGGPAASVDTACSSSAVALDAARAAVRNGAARGAVAVGVNACLRPHTAAAVCALAALSSAGRCSALDAGADGYGRGEGAVALVVAHAGARAPLASLTSTAVNVASLSAALTAPSGPAQAALLDAVMAGSGGVAASSLALHGTGTPLGDPIEVAAAKALSIASSNLRLSAPKAGLGHTEGAAGGAGALAAAAASRLAPAPPVARLRSLNPHVADALSRWIDGAAIGRAAGCPATGGLAVASAFGMSGVNAATALAPPPDALAVPTPPFLPWVHRRAYALPRDFAPAAVGRAAGRAAWFAPRRADAALAALAAAAGAGGAPALALEAAYGAAATLTDSTNVFLARVAAAAGARGAPAAVAVDAATGAVRAWLDGGSEPALTAIVVAVREAGAGRPRRRCALAPRSRTRPTASTLAVLAPADDGNSFVVHPGAWTASIALAGLATGRGLLAAAGAARANSGRARWAAAAPAAARAGAACLLAPNLVASAPFRDPVAAAAGACRFVVEWRVGTPAAEARRSARPSRPHRLVPSIVATAARLAAAAPASGRSTIALRTRGAAPAPAPGGARGRAGAAAAAALVRCLPYELASLDGFVVDGDLWGGGGEEGRYGGGDDAAVAGRAARVPRLAYAPPAAARAFCAPSSITITGGGGGLGALAGAAAAAGGAARVEMLARSARSAAPALLAWSPVPVSAAAADVARQADVADAASRSLAYPARPGGLVHSAGSPGAGALAALAPAATRSAVAPKAVALAALLAASAAAPLASVACFSSVSAVAGFGGHAPYAAANAAADSLAATTADAGVPVCSLQWGAWAGVGMAASRVRERDAAALVPAVGARALEGALAAAAAGVSPAVVGFAPRAYWQRLADGAGRAWPLVEEEVVAAAQAVDAQAAPAAAPTPTITTLDRVLAFIADAVADLTGAPPSPDAPLADSGVDSLAAIELRRRLAAAFGVDAPSAASPGVSAARLAADVVAASAGASARAAPPASSAWIAPATTTPLMRLFCLPYAGGVSEAVFGGWGRLLPPAVAVCPVELPGRGRRARDAPPADLRSLAAQLVAGLDLDAGPYALFGACLGAVLAYEVAAEAARVGARPPLALFVAAAAPPHLYAPAVARLYLPPGMAAPADAKALAADAAARLRAWKSLPKALVLSVFKAGNFAGVADMETDPRLYDRVAPVGVADILLAVTYDAPPPSRPALTCPILALDGVRDGTIARGAMLEWGRYAGGGGGGSFERVGIEGDHYFTATLARAVTALVGARLLDAADALPGGLRGAGHSWLGGA